MYDVLSNVFQDSQTLTKWITSKTFTISENVRQKYMKEFNLIADVNIYICKTSFKMHLLYNKTRKLHKFSCN